ncbi:MAG: tRNA pseudouridine(38-40) synthase TruA [Chloroherpetonaceae bacterium]|nr:tRNA pseudouridine(38-40) synthase TruA [Chloroherpetonaceae bacterium]
MSISDLENPRNFKLTIEYDGTDFAGWQRQPQNPHQHTIQGEIERVLAEVLQEPIEVFGAGRTDSGVHAKAQVANFHTSNPMTIFKLQYALNRMLPSGIRVIDMVEAPPDFHARYSAVSRTYRYFVATKSTALLSRFTGFYPPRKYNATTFNLEAMNAAAVHLYGENDFASFSKKHAESKHYRCFLKFAKWRSIRRNELLMFEITANRFLHSMVRLIVGTLIEVGAGAISQNEFEAIFNEKTVDNASALAEPSGLFLWKVEY